MSASGPFDLVHGFWGDPAGLLAARAGRHFGIPSVVTCDSGEFVSIPAIGYGSQRTARGRAIIQEACSVANRVHVCTRFMEQQARDHGVAATVIPLGTSAGFVSAKAPQRNINPASSDLLQIASLSRVKNQQLAIDAVALLSKRMDVHLDLVGEDTLGGELQATVRELGLADRVTFHGFLPQDELPRLFASADLYVQTSLHEAAGVSVLEAAGFGVPVIGTRVGYVADWTPHQRGRDRRSVGRGLRASDRGSADRCRSPARARLVCTSMGARPRRRSHGVGVRAAVPGQTARVSGRFREHTQRRHVALASTSRSRRNAIADGELSVADRSPSVLSYGS